MLFYTAVSINLHPLAILDKQAHKATPFPVTCFSVTWHLRWCILIPIRRAIVALQEAVSWGVTSGCDDKCLPSFWGFCACRKLQCRRGQWRAAGYNATKVWRLFHPQLGAICLLQILGMIAKQLSPAALWYCTGTWGQAHCYQASAGFISSISCYMFEEMCTGHTTNFLTVWIGRDDPLACCDAAVIYDCSLPLLTL